MSELKDYLQIKFIAPDAKVKKKKKAIETMKSVFPEPKKNALKK